MSTPIPTIAVTGINGFVATEVVLLFLSRGWHVRGSVRTPSQADKLNTHPAYEAHIESGNLKVIVVADLAKSDLSELLDGVDAVASVAAPLPKLDNPDLTWDDFKGPTVEPILRFLHYAQKSSTIKSVALMSSLGSSLDLQPPPGKVYTENDWTPYSEDACKALDIKSNPLASVIWYFTAKKLAEEAVLQFQASEKPTFAISTFCPPMIYGPARFLSTVDDIKTIGGSQEEFLGLFAGKDQPPPSHQFSWSFIDVRDVAEAFYLGVTKKASGKFLVSGPGYTFQEFADRLRALRPDLDAFFTLGEPGRYAPYAWSVNASKSKKELGIQYHTMDETLIGIIEFYEKLGLFKQAPAGKKVES
ncbi:hypothetical protein IAR50_006945 [Cryptococcus sp. DSM 104548]